MPYTLPQEILDASHQVSAHQINGQRVYVKKRRRNKNPVGWLAQTILYRLTDNLLVLPPRRLAGDNVSFEAGVLRRLAANGLPVPEVLHVDEEYFVMSDVGQTLEIVLRERPADRDLIHRALAQLRRLHDSGFAHGGSQIKNLTVKDGVVHFIDFEEDIPEEHLGKFKIRDLFLFLLSLERNGHDPDLRALCRQYDGSDDGPALQAICQALGKMRLVRLFDNSVFAGLSMRDIRSLSNLVRKAGDTERSAAIAGAAVAAGGRGNG
ncbi:MAG: hypothetical protein LIP77_04630 [Planctomycetes bacterium]|nr:hypothetical protein [Planctomycetota bacterium]